MLRADVPTQRAYLLVASPDAPGGIARSTSRLANHLADTHLVEVIGLRRVCQQRHYPFDERVKVTYVVNEPAGFGRLVDRLPSVRAGMTRRQSQSALVDLLLPRVLSQREPGLVISTRPLLHVAAVRHMHPGSVLIGQDHVNLEFRRANRSLPHVARAIDRLDQFVVLTEADAAGYRSLFPGAADKIQVIPNASPWDILTDVRPRKRVIVAAGTLGRRKGFDRLIDAFARIAPQCPGWRVHIYGDGVQRAALAERIAAQGLTGRVALMGRTSDMPRVLEEAAIFALTSRHEGLPMVLIEAMTKGVPVVSFDCPHGPAEMVVDGVTGSLVDNGDVEGFANALLGLMDDPGRRLQMGRRALERAERYEAEIVMRSWNELLDTLSTRRAASLDRQPQPPRDQHPLHL